MPWSPSTVVTTTPSAADNEARPLRGFCPTPEGCWAFSTPKTCVDNPAPSGYSFLMTRKHFEAIASIIDSQRVAGQAAVWNLTIALADYFQRENPRFDRNAFLTACGY